MTHTPAAALLCIVHRDGVTTISSRAGTDLGRLSYNIFNNQVLKGLNPYE